MSRYYEERFFSQPSSAEIKRKSAASTKRMSKKMEVHPIVVNGRNIASSWWGQAWCKNLEKYADFSSRIDRGKRYVRSGAVVDLQIKKGKVNARVQGTRKTPYKVEVRISPLNEDKCQSIITKCSSKIDNLESLINGDFPEELKELFTAGEGLFPLSKEISFSCSCPDWALMCKHVAAVLYGIGVKFDEDPRLFFELRGIDINRFIDVAIAGRVEEMLKNENRKSRRIMDNIDITTLFGI